MFRNSVGFAMHGERKVRYGLLKGSSDLIGILAPTGRLVSLEVKTEDGRVTDEQERWLKMVRAMGGFACVVRSVEGARAAVDRARWGGFE